MDARENLTPVIAIVGRTNVGKSTLFNRFIEERKAITSAEENTTRDLNFAPFEWRGIVMTAIDTAGIDLTKKNATDEQLKRQAQIAMDKADIILMTVDGETGPLPQDKALAKHLLKSNKKVILVVNKVDNPRARRKANKPDWLKLGLGEGNLCSAVNGSGVGDLLDVVVEEVQRQGLESKPLPVPDLKIVLIGRPNVGKSSLLNALAGEDRVIVSEVPHTTREPQDTMLTYTTEEGETKNILIMDTAGIRKRSRVTPGIEYIGVGKSFKEMREADIALLLMDTSEGFHQQDKKLIGLIDRSWVGVMVLANKWDIAEEERIATVEEFRDHLMQMLPFCRWAPIAFVSGKSGRNVGKLIPMALEIMKQRQKRIPQEEIDAFMVQMKARHHSAFKKGTNRPKVFGMTQTGTEPPEFTLVVKKKETIHPNYLRFIENRLREKFGFHGTPIRLEAREITKGRQTKK
jgi:GTP-binding protein